MGQKSASNFSVFNLLAHVILAVHVVCYFYSNFNMRNDYDIEAVGNFSALPNCEDIIEVRNIDFGDIKSTESFSSSKIKAELKKLGIDDYGCFQPYDCVSDLSILVLVPFLTMESTMNFVYELNKLMVAQKLSHCLATFHQTSDNLRIQRGKVDIYYKREENMLRT